MFWLIYHWGRAKRGLLRSERLRSLLILLPSVISIGLRRRRLKTLDILGSARQ